MYCLRNSYCGQRLLSVIRLLTLASMFALSHAYAGGHAAVSDDGEGVEFYQLTNEEGLTFDGERISTLPFQGKDNVTESDLIAEGAYLAGLDGELLPADVDKLLELKPISGPGSREVILGWDTRVRNYTVNYPASAVVLITFSGGRCTGFAIGADTVATAGHCVHTGGASGSWRNRGSYRIYPGYDHDWAPYGSCTAARLYSVNGWTESADERYDYGAIKLDCTVGNTVGWFGLTNSGDLGLPVVISGYPGDKDLEQWQSTDGVRAVSARQFFYANDTNGGMSGSPIWKDRWSEGKSIGPYVYAIHTYGTHGSSGPHAIYNHGTRVVSPVLQNFVDWINALP